MAIPFRPVPLEVFNLPLAGRCVAATHDNHASGTAAAMSPRAWVSPRRHDGADLRGALVAAGALI